MASATVNPRGHSESWLAQKKNVVAIFNEWRGVGFKWEEVTEKQATDPSLYEAFATYLLYEYTFASSGGERRLLKGKNVRNYVYVLVHVQSTSPRISSMPKRATQPPSSSSRAWTSNATRTPPSGYGALRRTLSGSPSSVRKRRAQRATPAARYAEERHPNPLLKYK